MIVTNPASGMGAAAGINRINSFCRLLTEKIFLRNKRSGGKRLLQNTDYSGGIARIAATAVFALGALAATTMLSASNANAQAPTATLTATSGTDVALDGVAGTEFTVVLSGIDNSVNSSQPIRLQMDLDDGGGTADIGDQTFVAANDPQITAEDFTLAYDVAVGASGVNTGSSNVNTGSKRFTIGLNKAYFDTPTKTITFTLRARSANATAGDTIIPRITSVTDGTLTVAAGDIDNNGNSDTANADTVFTIAAPPAPTAVLTATSGTEVAANGDPTTFTIVLSNIDANSLSNIGDSRASTPRDSLLLTIALDGTATRRNQVFVDADDPEITVTDFTLDYDIPTGGVIANDSFNDISFNRVTIALSETFFDSPATTKTIPFTLKAKPTADAGDTIIPRIVSVTDGTITLAPGNIVTITNGPTTVAAGDIDNNGNSEDADTVFTVGPAVAAAPTITGNAVTFTGPAENGGDFPLILNYNNHIASSVTSNPAVTHFVYVGSSGITNFFGSGPIDCTDEDIAANFEIPIGTLNGSCGGFADGPGGEGLTGDGAAGATITFRLRNAPGPGGLSEEATLTFAAATASASTATFAAFTAATGGTGIPASGTPSAIPVTEGVPIFQRLTLDATLGAGEQVDLTPDAPVAAALSNADPDATIADDLGPDRGVYIIQTGGSASAISVEAETDDIVEGPEYFQIGGGNVVYSHALLGLTPADGILTYRIEDATTTNATVTLDATTVDEGGTLTATVTLDSDKMLAEAATFVLERVDATDGSPTQAEDADVSFVTVAVPAGVLGASGAAIVTITDSDGVDPGESFKVGIDLAASTYGGGRSLSDQITSVPSADVAITNTDVPPPAAQLDATNGLTLTPSDGGSAAIGVITGNAITVSVPFGTRVATASAIALDGNASFGSIVNDIGVTVGTTTRTNNGADGTPATASAVVSAINDGNSFRFTVTPQTGDGAPVLYTVTISWRARSTSTDATLAATNGLTLTPSDSVGAPVIVDATNSSIAVSVPFGTESVTAVATANDFAASFGSIVNDNQVVVGTTTRTNNGEDGARATATAVITALGGGAFSTNDSFRFSVTPGTGANVLYTVTITVTVPPGPVFASTQGDLHYAAGSGAIEDVVLPEASGGTGAISYALTPDPAATLAGTGLSYNTGTRTISGTPTGTTTFNQEFTYTATDSASPTALTRSVTFRIVITPAVTVELAATDTELTAGSTDSQTFTLTMTNIPEQVTYNSVLTDVTKAFLVMRLTDHLGADFPTGAFTNVASNGGGETDGWTMAPPTITVPVNGVDLSNVDNHTFFRNRFLFDTSGNNDGDFILPEVTYTFTLTSKPASTANSDVTINFANIGFLNDSNAELGQITGGARTGAPVTFDFVPAPVAAPASVTVTSTATAVTEGAAFTITVALDNPVLAGGTVTLPYTFSGTGIADTDFSYTVAGTDTTGLTGNSLVFEVGDQSIDIVVTTSTDGAESGGSETLKFKLDTASSPYDGVVVEASDEVDIAITDAVTASLVVNSTANLSVLESTTGDSNVPTYNVTLTLPAQPTGAVSVLYQSVGTAIVGNGIGEGDFAAIAGSPASNDHADIDFDNNGSVDANTGLFQFDTGDFTNGVATFDIFALPVDDRLEESDETVILNLRPVDSAGVFIPGIATLTLATATLTDNDAGAPDPTFAYAETGDQGTLTIDSGTTGSVTFQIRNYVFPSESTSADDVLSIGISNYSLNGVNNDFKNANTITADDGAQMAVGNLATLSLPNTPGLADDTRPYFIEVNSNGLRLIVPKRALIDSGGAQSAPGAEDITINVAAGGADSQTGEYGLGINAATLSAGAYSGTTGGTLDTLRGAAFQASTDGTRRVFFTFAAAAPAAMNDASLASLTFTQTGGATVAVDSLAVDGAGDGTGTFFLPSSFTTGGTLAVTPTDAAAATVSFSNGTGTTATATTKDGNAFRATITGVDSDSDTITFSVTGGTATVPYVISIVRATYVYSAITNDTLTVDDTTDIGMVTLQIRDFRFPAASTSDDDLLVLNLRAGFRTVADSFVDSEFRARNTVSGGAGLQSLTSDLATISLPTNSDTVRPYLLPTNVAEFRVVVPKALLTTAAGTQTDIGDEDITLNVVANGANAVAGTYTLGFGPEEGSTGATRAGVYGSTNGVDLVDQRGERFLATTSGSSRTSANNRNFTFEADEETDASLADLTAGPTGGSAVAFTTAYSQAAVTNAYEVNLPFGTANVDVVADPNTATAVVTSITGTADGEDVAGAGSALGGQVNTAGAADATITANLTGLVTGRNTIEVLVTAGDTTTQRTYTLTATVAAPRTTATLSDLELRTVAGAAETTIVRGGGCIAGNVFAPGCTTYTARFDTVPAGNTAHITPVSREGSTFVVSNGTASGDGFTVPVSLGFNTITVTVTPEDGDTSNNDDYTIALSIGSHDTSLGTLSVTQSGESAVPATGSGLTRTVNLFGTATAGSITIDPTDANARVSAVTGSNITVASANTGSDNTATHALTGIADNSSIRFTVTSQSGITADYTLRISLPVQEVDNADLGSLTVGTHDLSTGEGGAATFDADVLNYGVTLPDGTTTATITATPDAAANNADITIAATALDGGTIGTSSCVATTSGAATCTITGIGAGETAVATITVVSDDSSVTKIYTVAIGPVYARIIAGTTNFTPGAPAADAFTIRIRNYNRLPDGGFANIRIDTNITEFGRISTGPDTFWEIADNGFTNPSSGGSYLQELETADFEMAIVDNTNIVDSSSIADNRLSRSHFNREGSGGGANDRKNFRVVMPRTLLAADVGNIAAVNSEDVVIQLMAKSDAMERSTEFEFGGSTPTSNFVNASTSDYRNSGGNHIPRANTSGNAAVAVAFDSATNARLSATVGDVTVGTDIVTIAEGDSATNSTGTVTLESTDGTATFSATTAVTGATVTSVVITGTGSPAAAAVGGASPTFTSDLSGLANGGTYEIVVRVTASDTTTTRDYTIALTIEDPAADATLAALTVDDATPIGFDADAGTGGTIVTDIGTTSITLVADPNSDNADITTITATDTDSNTLTVTVTGGTLTTDGDTVTATVAVVNGANDIVITVTPTTGAAVVYTVEVTVPEAIPADLRLTSLNVDGTAPTGFDSVAGIGGSIEVPVGTTGRVIADPASATASILRCQFSAGGGTFAGGRSQNGGNHTTTLNPQPSAAGDSFNIAYIVYRATTNPIIAASECDDSAEALLARGALRYTLAVTYGAAEDDADLDGLTLTPRAPSEGSAETADASVVVDATNRSVAVSVPSGTTAATATATASGGNAIFGNIVVGGGVTVGATSHTDNSVNGTPATASARISDITDSGSFRFTITSQRGTAIRYTVTISVRASTVTPSVTLVGSGGNIDSGGGTASFTLQVRNYTATLGTGDEYLAIGMSAGAGNDLETDQGISGAGGLSSGLSTLITDAEDFTIGLGTGQTVGSGRGGSGDGVFLLDGAGNTFFVAVHQSLFAANTSATAGVTTEDAGAEDIVITLETGCCAVGDDFVASFNGDAQGYNGITNVAVPTGTVISDSAVTPTARTITFTGVANTNSALDRATVDDTAVTSFGGANRTGDITIDHTSAVELEFWASATSSTTLVCDNSETEVTGTLDGDSGIYTIAAATVSEGDNVFNAHVTAQSGTAPASCATADVNAATATTLYALTVTVDPPATPPASVTVTSAETAVNEGDDAFNITVALNAPVVSGTVTLPYVFSGTDIIAGTDFTYTVDGGATATALAASLVFDVTEDTKTIAVTVLDDSTEEAGGETLKFKLTANDGTGSGYNNVVVEDGDEVDIAISDPTSAIPESVMRETTMISQAVGKEQVGMTTRLIRQRISGTFSAPSSSSAITPQVDPGLQLSLAENPQTIQDFFSQMALEKSGGMDQGGNYAVWVRGQYVSVSGSPSVAGAESFEYDGTIAGVGSGIERRYSNYLVGLSLNYSTADIDSKSGLREQASYKETMNIIAPYAAWQPQNLDLTLWGTAGYGIGSAEISSSDHTTGSPSVSMFFAQGGVNHTVSFAENSSIVLGVSALSASKSVDAYTVDIGPVPVLKTDIFQAQADATIYMPVTFGESVVRPYFGIATVHDIGDVQTDDRHAMEGRVGVSWLNGPWNLNLEGFNQFLREDEKAWGVFGEVSWAGNSDFDGLFMGVTGGHGTAASMSDAAANTDSVSEIDTAISDADSEVAEWSFQTNTEYGFPAPLVHRDGRATPFFRTTHSADARVFESGMRLDVTNNVGLTMDTKRHMPADDAPYSEHAVGLEARWEL